jgi:mRNA-degrading endonuclease toxin of MazEF toxin-antitoxin module
MMVAARLPIGGENWFVNFNPAVGGEIRNGGPALVMSLDTIGRFRCVSSSPFTDWNHATRDTRGS